MSSCPRTLRLSLWVLAAAALFGLAATAAHAQTAPDGPFVGVVPARNSVLATPPVQVRLTAPGALDPAASALSVYTTAHEAVPTSPLRLGGATDQAVLIEDLPQLAPGLYTIVWRTADQATHGVTTGSSTFMVDPSGGSPHLVAQPLPQFNLPTFDRIVPRWLAFAGVMTVVGTLALRQLVWRPALGASAVLMERRLVTSVGVAAVLFLVASSLEFANQAATVAPTARTMWTIRLSLTALAVVCALTALWRVRRSGAGGTSREGVAEGLLWATLVLCCAELLIRTLPGAFPVDVPRQVFTSALDWSHLLGGSLWIGGLVGLALSVPLLSSASGLPLGTAGTVIRRFSGMALVCVGVMIASGLWTAWIHVGDPNLLLTTLYGRTLAAKLVLVCALIALGAVNLLWLLPRLEEIQQSDPMHPSLLAVTLGHFRRVIGLEVVVGLAILFTVPFLTGSARNQALQTQALDLTQTALTGNLPVSLRPSALQPGFVDYDVLLPPTADARRVTLTFAAPDLDIPPLEVLAESRGAGMFRASGMYASVIGNWQVQVDVLQDGSDGPRTASFVLPVQADPLRPPAAPTPVIMTSTWVIGALEVAAISVGLFVAHRLSMRLARP